MKVEIEADLVEQVVLQELKNWVEMAEEFNGDHPEDIEFWSGMKAACEWILKHNFHVG